MKGNSIKRKKALLCTYNLNNYVLVRYRELLAQYDIIGMDISRKKILKGKDWAYLYMGENTGMYIEEDIDIEYEVVILGDGTSEYNFEELEKQVKKAARDGKEICMLYMLSAEHENILLKISSEYNINIYMHYGTRLDLTKIEIDDKRIYEMDVPVILITGITEQAKKLDCVLSIKKHFEKNGYKVSAIGNKNFSNLFGIHAFPQFMYENMQEDKKILYFNAICKNIEFYEKPDLLVVGVPGSSVPYNNAFTNFFGILPYEVSQAVEPDHVILSIPYGDYDENFFEEIAGIVKYKLGCKGMSFGMTNCFVDINSSKEENKVQYCNLRYEDIEKTVRKKSSNKIYNLLSDNQLSEMAGNIMDTLSYI